VRDALLVALGGAIGSVLRWAVAMLLVRRGGASAFPWATLGVNLAGSLAIGCILGTSLVRGAAPPAAVRLFFVVGMLGGFTTFSAFSWETFALLRTGAGMTAAFYVAASILGGLAATALGAALVARA
jgi:CrcB protein